MKFKNFWYKLNSDKDFDFKVLDNYYFLKLYVYVM